MSKLFLSNIDLNGNQIIQGLAEVLGTDPSTLLNEGRFWVNSTTHKFKVRLNGVSVSFYADTATLDTIVAAAADVSLNSHKITNLADPTVDTDAANKRYVDSAIQGMSPKEAVVVASTVNIASLSGLLTIDGITVAAGDRVLVKDQSTASQNGIYVAAVGAWTRASDADATGELDGALVFVDSGTAGGQTLWVLPQTNVIPGTTSQTWVQFAAITATTAGNGLSLSGLVMSVNVDGSTIEINSDTLRVKDLGITGAKIAGGAVDLTTKVTGILPIGNGGTSASTAAAARNQLGTASVYAADITGDGSSVAFNVDHNLNTKDLVAQIWEATTDQQVEVDMTRSTVNRLIVTFATAPALSKVYRVVIFAKA